MVKVIHYRGYGVFVLFEKTLGDLFAKRIFIAIILLRTRLGYSHF